MRRLLLSGYLLLICFGFGLVHAPLSRASELRVCADPNYMPFSDRAGEGFENKVAVLTAKLLGSSLVYTWASTRGTGGFSEFLSRNLDAGKCDAIMSMPYGSQEELTTDPYYMSSYVFISKKNKSYDLESMDSPILRKVRIGFERDTPPEDGLKLRDLLTQSEPFSVGDTENVSPASMLQAIENGRIDVMITWEPAVGFFLRNYPDLAVSRVPNQRTTGSPEQYLFPMSMAVRKNDETLKKRLDEVIKAHKESLQVILNQYNIRLYPAAGDVL
ncbi:MAG TPA: transporter substrate-binding domain-containing protein [Candidatus Binataceae bacterium]|nr:transporter substrate-binding domain-containing protein [Candidatus Binataceae bacterium]